MRRLATLGFVIAAAAWTTARRGQLTITTASVPTADLRPAISERYSDRPRVTPVPSTGALRSGMTAQLYGRSGCPRSDWNVLLRYVRPEWLQVHLLALGQETPRAHTRSSIQAYSRRPRAIDAYQRLHAGRGTSAPDRHHVAYRTRTPTRLTRPRYRASGGTGQFYLVRYRQRPCRRGLRYGPR